MIPYPYNMVDMGGIDLAEANHTVVPGIYEKLTEAMNACGDLILYNWFFCEIPIQPEHLTVLQTSEGLLINGLIQVTELDEISVLGIEPPPPPILPVEPITISENGVYRAEEPVSGFNPVTVDVPIPTTTLVSLSVQENGEYSPQDYNADGFSSVEVSVTPSKYEEVQTDFLGLATAYQALNGSFYTERTKIQCLFFAKVENGKKYVVFLPERYSNRFRAALWPGKTIDDFLPYLDVLGTNNEIYSGATMITPSNIELSGDGLTRRFFFTGVDGEVLVGTSNELTIVKPILLKIQEG